MRLWHYKLIPYLPDSQLKAQWRELNAIYKNQPKHILINYIYTAPKQYLLDYSDLVISEMTKRGFHVNTNKYQIYFDKLLKMIEYGEPQYFKEHNFDYLTQCFYNLQEKYQRGQQDFTEDRYNKLMQFYVDKSWVVADTVLEI